MIKKLFVFLLALTIGITIFGCAKVADTSSSGGGGTTGILPSGTTQCKLSASNISASGNTLSLALTALNQNNSVISGLGGGNFTGAIYAGNPSISGLTASTTLTAVATVAFTAMTGGTAGTAKDIAAALVIDKSGSMYPPIATVDKLTSAETAAKKFVDILASASSSNKAAIVNFSTSVTVEAPIMPCLANLSTLNLAITEESKKGGSTAVYYAIANGIWEASKEAASSNKIRAVVALTDGGENASPAPYNGITTGTVEVVNQAIKYGIPVYTVGLFMDTAEATSYSKGLKSIAKETTGSEDNYFEVIVGVTGLSILDVKALGVLTDLYAKLATALSQSYSATATLSSSLTAGRTYWLKLDFTAQVQGGGTITTTVIVSFVAS